MPGVGVTQYYHGMMHLSALSVVQCRPRREHGPFRDRKMKHPIPIGWGCVRRAQTPSTCPMNFLPDSFFGDAKHYVEMSFLSWAMIVRVCFFGWLNVHMIPAIQCCWWFEILPTVEDRLISVETLHLLFYHHHN